MSTRSDPVLEKQVLDWLETITGRERAENTAHEWLLDGSVLCELANKIKEGAVSKFHKDTNQLFKQRENITIFLRAIRNLGMREQDMFSTADLYEGSNMGLVISSLYNLGGTIQTTVPEFQGPHIGIKRVNRKSTKSPQATPSAPKEREEKVDTKEETENPVEEKGKPEVEEKQEESEEKAVEGQAEKQGAAHKVDDVLPAPQVKVPDAGEPLTKPGEGVEDK